MAVRFYDAIVLAQRELNIPDYRMCDILNISEEEMRKMHKRRHADLNGYQQAMFMISTCRPLFD